MVGCSGDSWDSLASVVEFGIYYGIWRDVFFKCFFGLHVSDKDVYGDSLWCLSRLKKDTATTSQRSRRSAWPGSQRPSHYSHFDPFRLTS